MLHTQLAKDFSVSRIGLGCSSMSHGYGPDGRDDEASVEVLHRAFDLGVNLFDTAEVYGPYANESLLGRALRPHLSKVKIATKCGLMPLPDGRFRRNGRPEHLKKACDGSLRRLGVDSIDLYQLHRVDPEVSIEETWGALSELVAAGKVRALGVSHATLAELDVIHSIHPLTAVQYELSVWAKTNADTILPWCRDHQVGFMAFAPIGRGFLSGTVSRTSLAANDSRTRDPRFEKRAMDANNSIVDGLRKISDVRMVTPAQVAIAWTLAQGDNVVPIPGTRRKRWLEENLAACNIALTGPELKILDELPVATGEMCWDADRAGHSRDCDAAAATQSTDSSHR